MKSGISCFCLFIIFSLSATADAFIEHKLKDAASVNGYRLPNDVNVTFDTEKADIGKVLFESKKLSFNGDTSCSSCHLDEFSSADGLPNAIGVGGSGKGVQRMASSGALVPRNTLALWGRAADGFTAFFWDGKVESKKGEITSQFGVLAPSDDPLTVAIHLPFVEIREMVVDDLFVDQNLKNEKIKSAEFVQEILVQRALNDLGLSDRISSSYGVSIEDIEFLHLADAIRHHFAEKFALQPTKFSKFMDGKGGLSASEVRGGIIFYGKGMCSTCHSGPHFSDFNYHNIALPQAGPGKNGFGVDYGRFNSTYQPIDLYKFRTPPLHNVEKTAPYGHSGSVFELRDVVVAHFDPLSLVNIDRMTDKNRRDFYAKLVATPDGQPIPATLTKSEISDLLSFLKTLSF